MGSSRVRYDRFGVMMMKKVAPVITMIALATCPALLIAPGCVRYDPGNQNAPQPAQGQTSADGAGPAAGGSEVVTVAEDDPAMTAAIAEARATAAEARARWALASSDEREWWSVKWGAPTTSGDIEHIWVTPVSWSGFRIEGWLANEPIAELECGRRLGQMVSFPIDELSDWVHFLEQRFDGPREGGFTIDALEQ